MLLDQWSVLFDRNVLLDGADGWEMQPVDGSVKTLWSHQPTATPPPPLDGSICQLTPYHLAP